MSMSMSMCVLADDPVCLACTLDMDYSALARDKLQAFAAEITTLDILVALAHHEQ